MQSESFITKSLPNTTKKKSCRKCGMIMTGFGRICQKCQITKQKERLSLKRMAKKSLEFKRKSKKREFSDEHRKKISLAHKGRKRPPFSKETRRRMSESRLKRKKILGYINSPQTRMKMSKCGEKNNSWKGSKIGKRGVHNWVVKIKGKPNFCEHCKMTDKKKYEWANKNHTYKRKINDYVRLCSSCHRIYDLKNNSFPNNYQKYVIKIKKM